MCQRADRWVMSGARKASLAILLATVIVSCGASTSFSQLASTYELPIQQHPAIAYRHQYRYQHLLNHARPQQESQRRSDSENQLGSSGDENEEQLRQLHQAVNTVAQLLNEEEKQAAAQRSNSKTQPTSELLSESAIRRAIEELERVQQQERQVSAGESRPRPVVVADDGLTHAGANDEFERLSKHQQQSALAGLIDELGDELMDGQLATASQETERMFRQGRASVAPASGSRVAPEVGQQGFQQKFREASSIGDTATTTTPTADATTSRSGTTESPRSSDQQETFNSTMASSTTTSSSMLPSSSSSSPLFIGQLDSFASELGPALTNDFYTFHAESNGASTNRQPSQDDSQSSGLSNDQQDQQLDLGRNKAISELNSASSQPAQRQQNDLESAAQTRNVFTQRDPQAQNPFEQDPGSLRFDFSQPVSSMELEGDSALQQQQPAPLRQQRPMAQANEDALVRAFRQQTGAAAPSDNNGQFPTSTLIPLTNSDNFWRPSNANNQAVTPTNEDINQQYNRALSTQQSAPLLPPARFQSASVPQVQFSQPSPSSRQSQHIHFTGHSFIPSTSNSPNVLGQSQFSTPQSPPQLQPPPSQPQAQSQQPQSQLVNKNNRGFPSTTAPLISVLSGSDTSSGNSVTWNPPATLNPPPPSGQHAFNQQFHQPTSTQSSLQNANTETATQFFNQPNRGPPSPLFRGAFQGPPDSFVQEPPQKSEFKNFASSTEANNQPPVESSTVGRFPPQPPQVSPMVPAQWIPPTNLPSQGQPVEREVSDSQPRSSVRSLQNNQRFFEPNDNVGPTSTSSPPLSSSPFNMEPLRTSRVNNISNSGSAASTTTTTSTTTPASIAANTTKKEDMVIYYYYYYDDNKNATVVAKNISSITDSSPNSGNTGMGLDAAIEADGGVEDTPYMDDPAPISNLRTNSIKPAVSQHPSTSTTSTTTFSPLNSNFESTTHDNRLRTNPSSAGVRAQPPTSDSTLSHSRLSQLDRGSANNELTLSTSSGGDLLKHSNQSNHPRTSTGGRGTTTHPSRLSNQDQMNTFTPTPYNVPSTSSFRPPGSSSSRPSSGQQDIGSNRFVTTDSSSPISLRGSLNGQHRAIEPIAPNSVAHQHNQHQSSSTASTLSSNKLQSDLIQNVLNGVNSSNQPRQPASLSTVPSTISSSTTAASTNNRGPLSNASRYGTNNNLMLDPYGLDPAAPAFLAHSSHHQSSADNSINHHHKHWQQGAGAQVVPQHQFNRKPTANAITEKSPITVDSSSTLGSNALVKHQGSSGTSRSSSNQSSFSSQRNSNVESHSATRAPAPQSGSRNNNSGNAPVSRQFFPESHGQPQTPPNVEHSSSEHAVRGPTNQKHTNTVAAQQQQPSSSPPPTQRQQASQAADTNQNEFTSTRLLSSSEEMSQQGFTRESSPHKATNGRPQTQEGNTGNGFTRSPIGQSVSTSVSPPSVVSGSGQPRTIFQGSTSDRGLVASSNPTTTQSTISTSVSRSSVTLPHIQITTSVSPPTITSSTSTSTQATFSSSSLSPTSSQAPSSTQLNSSMQPSTIPPQMKSPSTPVPSAAGSQENTSSATESSSDLSSSTRKKFGNRTNRFQTRLSANALKSTTSTTTTTQAPSISSTTRRPTTSTTRKSNKQLFAGRRRLSSAQTSADNANASSSNSTLASGPINNGNNSPSLDLPASSTGRSRFGNSNPGRTRSTTAAPSATNGGTSEQMLSSTQKPGLNAQQRATVKPRLPFLKTTKPDSATSSGAETGGAANLSEVFAQGSNSGLSSETSLMSQPVNNNSSEKLPTADKSNDVRSGEGSNMEEAAPNSSTPEDESSSSAAAVMKKETSTSTTTNDSSVAPETTTAAPIQVTPTPEATGAARNKPKLRPLFASRQRNTALFGNRRSSSASTST